MTASPPAIAPFASSLPRHPRAVLLSCGLTIGLCVALVGCGNYSNEDLEFMSVIPQHDDLAAELPPTSSALITTAADGWKTTVSATQTFNGAADAFLALIEKIRSTYPTARDANARIWGPFPADGNPGWQVEFRMTKDLSGASSGASSSAVAGFTYELVMIPPAGVPLLLGGAETQIIAGNFAATGGVRTGSGHLALTLGEARTAGVVFVGLDHLQNLTIDYDTQNWPRHTQMDLIYDPPADPAVDVASASYSYQRSETGDGQMTFTIAKDIVAAAPGSSTLQITSHWRGTGEGREDSSVIGGYLEGMASSTECWDRSFASTYKTASWDPSSTAGDPATCIPLP